MPSTTSTATSTAASATNTCSVNLYELPTKDMACAVGSTSGSLPSNATDVLKNCCNGAPVESYDNGCGQYCLAYQQSGDALTKCLYSGGIAYNDVFCSKSNLTHTATGSVSPTSSADSESSGSSSSGSSDSKSAAAQPNVISVTGLGVLAMMFGSFVAGALI